MTAFWLAAALMTAVTVLAIGLPLFRKSSGRKDQRADYDITVYKDQLAEIDRDIERGILGEAEADAAKIEIQRRMLKAADAAPTGDGKSTPSRNPAVAWALALCVGAGAFGLYALQGSPDMHNRPYAKRDIGAETAARKGRLERGEVLQLTSRLIENLKTRPDDLKGWMLLGRTYMTIEDFDSALDAFRRALSLSGGRPDIATEYAEAMVMAGKGTVSAPAMKLFADTLASYPFDHKARYYLGLAKAQSGDLRGALQDWIDLGMLSPPGAPWMETVNQQIKGISGELGIDPAIIKPSPKVLALSRGPSPEDVKAAEQMSADDRQKMIRSMVQRLADRLAENPDDLAGWQRLAKAYEVLGEAAKAEEVRKRIEAMALKAR
jgi:cytochrome c-type biogenesis protein CcmH